MKSWRKYIGFYHQPSDDCQILIEDFEGSQKIGQRLLPLHLEIYNHSPTGFSWGYNDPARPRPLSRSATTTSSTRPVATG